MFDFLAGLCRFNKTDGGLLEPNNFKVIQDMTPTNHIGSSHRQRDIELQSATLGIAHGNSAIMKLHGIPDNRQPKP